MDWLAAEPGDFFYMIKQLAAVLVHEKIHAMEQEHSPILESLSRSRLMWLAALGNEIHEWHPYVVELRFLRNIHFWLGRVRPKNWQDKQAEVRQEIIDAFDELGRAGGPSEELKKQMEDEGIRFALAPGAGAAVATVRAGQGLNTVVFRTASGDKLVHVTDDLASGDTFSGTVEDVLAGKTEQERAASQDELSGLVVEVAGESVPQRTKWFKRTAPAVAVLPVLLRNRQGRVVATADVPVLAKPPATATPAPAAPSHPAAPGPPPAAVTPATPTPAPGFKFPSLGQTGRLAAITGGFSGDHSLTEGRIGGKEMDIRAISPRKLVFSNRRDVIGPTEIELKEKGQVIRSPYRSVDLALRATKTRMKPSETATLYTDLRGLAGLATPLTIAHQNLSPAVVRLPGGTHPKVTLLPSQVGPGGVATIPLTLVAVRTGGFTIRVSCTGETDDDCDKLYQEMEEKKAEATKRRVEAEAKKALAAKADKGGPGSYRDAARGKQAEADRKKAVAVKADGNAARAEAVNDSRQAARSRANARTINAEATKLEGEAKEANDTADALEKEGVPDDLRGRSAAAKRLKAEAKDAEDRAKDLEQDVGKLREAYDKCRKGI